MHYRDLNWLGSRTDWPRKKKKQIGDPLPRSVFFHDFSLINLRRLGTHYARFLRYEDTIIRGF